MYNLLVLSPLYWSSYSEGFNGETYARIHLTAINYEDAEDANSDITWIFELDIAPK